MLSKHFDDKRAENKADAARARGAHLSALHNTSTECSSSACYGLYSRTFFLILHADVSASEDNEFDLFRPTDAERNQHWDSELDT